MQYMKNKKGLRTVVLVMMCLCGMLMFSSSTVQAQRSSEIHLGIGGGAGYPLDDFGEVTDMTASAHGTLLYPFKERFAFEGNGGWWWFMIPDADDDFSMSLINVTGGVRYYPNSEGLHIDGGAGLYRFSWEASAGRYELEDSKTEFGLYGGVGYDTGTLDLNVRLHKSEFYLADFWVVGASATIFFN